MPSVRLYGRRWHFSSDIVAVPALLSAAFHVAWIVILLAWAAATDGWPRHCASSSGEQYAVLFVAFLAACATNLAIDLLLAWHSLRGAPFEASKRAWVALLLYASTAPLVVQLGLAAWGAYVSTQLQPECWPPNQRNAVTNVAQGMVFSTWGFMFIAGIGIAVTYNAYPQHHDLSSWEARCECVAATLCCHQNVVRRPDGKRPPLTNIAELTAGLLSHVDLDATDITAALFLASAAQNRRRRLRIAKALLPVYKALRSGGPGASGGSADGGSGDEGSAGWEEGGDDDASSATSVNDLPADRELDRMIADQEAQQASQRAARQAAPARAPAGDGAAGPASPPPQPKPARRGKTVSWAQDRLEGAAAAATAGLPPETSPAAAAGPPDLSGISLPPPAARLQQAEQREQERQAEGEGPAAAAQAAAIAPESADSLPLTAENVAMLDTLTGAVTVSQAPPEEQQAADEAARTELAAEELLERLPVDLPDREVADQLAGAIEEELQQLGGAGLPMEAVELRISKEESLDLSALHAHLQQEGASIWFSTASSQQGAPLSSAGSQAPGAGSGALPADVAAAAAGEQQAQEALDAASPFYTAGGGAASGAAQAGQPSPEAPSEAGKTAEAMPAEGHRTSPLPAAEAIPPADEAAAAAVAEVAAAAAGNGSPKSAGQYGGEEAALAAGGSTARVSVSSSRLDVQRQLTLKYPTILTPSEHVEDFRGPLPAAALADLYAGRHERVPSEVLREALHFLKYSYAVYSLEPKIEAPASALDLVCCCGCTASPRDPQKVVFRGLSELEALDDDASIELLHLNCSNRVLAHLPYMICLDHGKKAVVVAIRGTISAADIVTDAVLYPEPLDAWLPADIQRELSEPAFAHAGMVSAAKAIFEDMTERGILQQARSLGLVRDEEVGDFTTPPQQQRAQRGAGYDAESGRASPSSERYGSRVSGGGGSASSAEGSSASGGASPTNVQSAQRGDSAGRLWEGTSQTVAVDGRQAAAPAGPAAAEEQEGGREGFQHFSMHQGGRHARRAGAAHLQLVAEEGSGPAEAAQRCELSPGRHVGEIMRRKVEQEGWQLIVQGHSLGAGAAALVSLKLRESFPGLKCIAYSCPGGLVSKNLAHAMRRFTTTVVVGKDAVPRATVGNLARLMDEMVTALARCRQPKLKVLLFPWWRKRREHLRDLFWEYDEIPPEPLRVLQRYYESRQRLGQPLSMYPPGRVIFLRPIKTLLHKTWQAVWIEPEDIIAEGLLISPHMYRDHLCSTAFEALTAAADRAGQLEGGQPADADWGPPEEAAARQAVATRAAEQRRRRQAEEARRQRAARRRWQQRLQAQQSGSLQEVLIAG